MGRKAAELRFAVVQQSIDKERELGKRVSAQLEQALGPALERLDTSLGAERGRVTAGNGTRERETLLAAQLAATLAFAGKEAEQLTGVVRGRIAQRRAQLLEDIDAEIAAARPTLDVNAETDRIIAWKVEGSDAYLKGIHDASAQLDRYINLESPVSLFLRGLVGDNLGKRLGDLIDTQVDTLVKRGEEAAKTMVEKGQRLLHSHLAGADDAISKQ